MFLFPAQKVNSLNTSWSTNDSIPFQDSTGCTKENRSLRYLKAGGQGMLIWRSFGNVAFFTSSSHFWRTWSKHRWTRNSEWTSESMDLKFSVFSLTIGSSVGFQNLHTKLGLLWLRRSESYKTWESKATCHDFCPTKVGKSPCHNRLCPYGYTRSSQHAFNLLGRLEFFQLCFLKLLCLGDLSKQR